MFNGSIHKSGYGYFFVSGTMIYAHRFSWTIHNGSIPKGKLVLHRQICSTKNCINPDHLYLGNQSDNMCDKAIVNPGINNGRQPRFKQNTVDEIRKVYSGSSLVHNELSKIYKCGSMTIWKILNYKYPYER